MSQEYTEDKEVKLTKLSSGRRLLEAMLILCSLFAIWLMAALLSFNPSDPSWSQTAWHEPIHNLGGAPGAWLADTLFFIFGVMAYTIPVIIIGGCWFAWRHQENDEYIDYFAVSLRLIGALALILTSCGLAAINADDIWYFASGEVIGSLLSTTLQPAAQQRRHHRPVVYLGGRADAVHRLVVGQHCGKAGRRHPVRSHLCQQPYPSG